MTGGWFCKPCSSSNHIQDTVKVDPNAILMTDTDKENASPQRTPRMVQTWREEEEKRCAAEQLADYERLKEMEARQIKQAVQEESRRREQEEKRRREEQEAAEAVAVAKATREELQRHAEREKRETAEELARQKRETAEELALQKREVAEELAQQKRETAEDLARQKREAEEELERQRRKQKEEEEHRLEQERVAAWCKTNGYESMDAKKKTFKKATKFPLHTAVKQKNREMVELLVKHGANKDATDSKGQTPFALAMKMNKEGSHDPILASLTEERGESDASSGTSDDTSSGSDTVAASSVH